MKADTLWHIYVLVDPRSDAIRYVGKTSVPRLRLSRHLTDSRKQRFRIERWVHSLLRENVAPAMRIIETGYGTGHEDAERKWIAHYRALGIDLVNTAPGGLGGRGPIPADELARLVAIHRGKKRSPETCERIRLSKLGFRMSPEAQARRVAKITGQKRSAETGAKIAASKVGKPRSPETRAKLAEALLGVRPSDETRAKLRAAQAARRERERLARAT